MAEKSLCPCTEDTSVRSWFRVSGAVPSREAERSNFIFVKGNSAKGSKEVSFKVSHTVAPAPPLGLVRMNHSKHAAFSVQLEMEFHAQRVSHQDLTNIVDNVLIVAQRAFLELSFVFDLHQFSTWYNDQFWIDRTFHREVSRFLRCHPPDTPNAMPACEHWIS